MAEYPIIVSPEVERQDAAKASASSFIQDDISVRDFMKLLRENGMESDAQVLDDMFANMNNMESQFRDMRQEIARLQAEVEKLSGPPSLTEQVKAEFYSRTTKMSLQLDEMSNRFVEAKNAIISMAKEGLSKFAEVGKSALHRACALMSDAGVKYLNQVANSAQAKIDNNKEIIARLDDLRDATKAMRQKRGNLMRSILGRSVPQAPSSDENFTLQTIRHTAEHNIKAHERMGKVSSLLATKLAQFRDRQQAAFKKNPSLDVLIKNAQTKSEQMYNNMKDKFKGQNRSGPAL